MVVRRIGQILVDMGFITDDQLEVILEEQQQRPGALLGKIAEELGLITDAQLAQGLAEQLGMQTIELADVQVQGEAAPRQIVRAIEYFGSHETPPDVLVITRGGGSPSARAG